MKFIVEKIANMVYVTSECGTIFYSWNEGDFTERKLKNAIKKIRDTSYVEVEFIRTF